jgi:hypothetical protein
MLRSTTWSVADQLRRVAAVLLAGVLTIGCRHASPSVTPEPESGMYEFVANIGSETLRGTMVVAQDTIVLQTQDAQCIPSPYSGRNSQTLVYNCRGTPGGRLVLDRRHPATQSMWYGTVTRTATRTVCDQWEVSASGQRVCTARRTENYDQLTNISGMIRTRRLTAG